MCVCVCLCVCVCALVCAFVGRPENNLRCHFSDDGHLLLTHVLSLACVLPYRARLTGRWASGWPPGTRGLLVSSSAVLGGVLTCAHMCSCVLMPGFSRWVLRIEPRPPCFQENELPTELSPQPRPWCSWHLDLQTRAVLASSIFTDPGSVTLSSGEGTQSFAHTRQVLHY